MANSSSTTSDPRPCFFRYITFIARSGGIITTIVLWACAIRMVSNHQTATNDYMHWYLLGVAPIVTFFEIAWLVDKLACCDDRGCCCQLWKLLCWIDNWRKTILYVCLAIPCLSRIVLLSAISGFVLIICGIMYLFKSFRYIKCWYKEDGQETRLVGEASIKEQYDTVQETTSAAVEPRPTETVPSAPSMEDQEDSLNYPVQASQ